MGLIGFLRASRAEEEQFNVQLERLGLRHLSRFSASQLSMLCSALARLRRHAFLNVVALRLVPVPRGSVSGLLGSFRTF